MMKSSKNAVSALQKCLVQYQPQLRTYAKVIRQQDPEDFKNMPVFQYRTENSKKKKRIYMWGNAMCGALGNANYLKPVRHKYALESMRKPCRLPFADLHKVRDVACGYGFTVFAASNEEKDFTLFGTGLNSDFQIGYHCSTKNRPLETVIQPVPIALPLFKMHTVATKVGCGRAHTIVLTDEEGVFSLGSNSYGQCGVPAEFNAKENSILKVHKIKDVPDNIKENKILLRLQLSQLQYNLEGRKKEKKKRETVVCGQDHTMLLTSDGKVYSFGWSADGQTGLGHYDNQFTPSLVKGDIENEKIVQLSCAADCVLAVSDKGEVFGWGNSEYAQLNSATDKQQINIPLHLKLNVGKVKQVAAGGTMCAVLTEKGSIYVWGYGILGQGPKVSSSRMPILLPDPLFGVNDFNDNVEVTQITCSLSHFAAVTNYGHLYMWGKNRNNCLGLEKEHNQYFPLRVCVPAEVLKVSCGVDHTAALCIPFA